MKKLVVSLLIMAMSATLLVGCGDNDNTNSANGTVVNQEAGNTDSEELHGNVTKIYETEDYMTYEPLNVEITYNIDAVKNQIDLYGEETQINIAENGEHFENQETGAHYFVMLMQYYEDAKDFYSSEKSSIESRDYYTDVVCSSLTTQMVGEVPTSTFTTQVTEEDGDVVASQYWVLEFEKGILMIQGDQMYDDASDLTEVQNGIGDLLVKVTVDGKLAKGSSSSTGNTAVAGEASEWLDAMITIDGVTYQFPMAAQELVDNGWDMEDGFPFPARPGSNALVKFTKGDYMLSTNVTSVTGTEVPMEEGSVSYITVYEGHNDNLPIVFPGGITLGMTKEEVEAILPSEFEYEAKYKWFKYRQEETMGQLVIEIQLTEDESTVSGISYSFWS